MVTRRQRQIQKEEIEAKRESQIGMQQMYHMYNQCHVVNVSHEKTNIETRMTKKVTNIQTLSVTRTQILF